VLSDWPLVPGESCGPQPDYLYAGDRLALQLDGSDGELPVRQFIAVDHCNSTRVAVTDVGGFVTVEEIDYYPFDGLLTGGPQPFTTHLVTGHERDTAELASNLDCMQSTCAPRQSVTVEVARSARHPRRGTPFRQETILPRLRRSGGCGVRVGSPGKGHAERRYSAMFRVQLRFGTGTARRR